MVGIESIKTTINIIDSILKTLNFLSLSVIFTGNLCILSLLFTEYSIANFGKIIKYFLVGCLLLFPQH